MAYSQQMIEAQRPEIARQAISGRVEAAAAKIERAGSFASALKSGVVSTLINTAILLVLATGLRLFGIDLLTAYEAIGTTNPSTLEQRD